MHTIPFNERRWCSPTEAALYLGKGRSRVWELIAQGKLDTVKDGHRRKVSVASVVAFGEAMASAA